MSDTIMQQEPVIRLAAFLGMLAIMAIWELAAPRRRNDIPRLIRWSNNFALVAVDTFVVRLVFPVLAVGLALTAYTQGWGLLGLVALPFWAEVLLAFLILDLTIYLQHMMFHYVPVLWRLHRMHHSDTDFDLSTGLRFHPLEIIASMVIKLAAVAIIGAPALAVLIFEVVLNATAIFNHGNVRMPSGVDRVIRWVMVTPDMHRVHHSVYPSETNSNFGFNLPWWDRLFGTYVAQPRDGHEDMQIGIERFRDRREQWLDKLILQPFRTNGRD